nr:U32 family peptidase [Desulfobulbaceae bacterium]
MATNITPKTLLPELLAPAGSLEKLKTAVHYGADAVYLGGSSYSLRAHAVMGRANLAEAIAYAHDHKVKTYITVNIMAHNCDLGPLPEYLNFLREAGADGLIIGDPGIVSIAKETVPELPIHLSTQANVTNKASALFWQNQGVERLNLARELSLKEIQEIREAVTLKLEIFVHGALCISYSGRCSLSLYMTGRDANQGNCAHPCRYRYQLEEEKRPGEFYPVEEDQHGTYIFNSKDLCLLNKIPQLIGCGADSLKLEGRMKSVYYVGATVRLYRAALDYIGEQMKQFGASCLDNVTLPAKLIEELPKIGSRGYTENFFSGTPGAEEMIYEGINVKQTHAPIGIVREIKNKQPLVEMRNPLFPGEEVEFLARDFSDHAFTVKKIISQKGEVLEKANPGNIVTLMTEPVLDCWEVLGLIRKKAAIASEIIELRY